MINKIIIIFLVGFHGNRINQMKEKVICYIIIYGCRVSYRGGGPGIFPLQLDSPPPPQDFEIQYDVIIIIMYTMDIVQ